MNKSIKFRYIEIISLICLLLVLLGCSELFKKKTCYPKNNENILKSSNTECESLTVMRLNNFYGVLSEIIRNDHKDDKKSKLDSLNYFWCQIIEDKGLIINCLINNRFECFMDRCLYGERYLSNLNIPLYPHSVHKIFWIKVLENDDFLFGRRFSFGDSSLIQSIHHPISIFPIFKNATNKTLLPDVDTSGMLTFDDYSYFRVEFIKYKMDLTVDSSYLYKVDSLLLFMKGEKTYTTDSLDVFWMNFEKRMMYDNSDTIRITTKILGKDACR